MNIDRPKSRRARRASYIIAKYTVSEGTYRDVIKNIGAGGLFIRTSRKIAAGQAIVLEFPVFSFDTTIQVSGRVTRQDRHGFAVVFDEPVKALIGDGGEVPRIVHEGDR
jgi:Tfp pilus assembly protein PilZ